MDRSEFVELAKNDRVAALLELFDMVGGLGDIVASMEPLGGGAEEAEADATDAAVGEVL